MPNGAHESILMVALAVGLGGCGAGQTSITADETRTIARDAYIYGFPVVDNYRVQYAYFVDRDNPEFKAPRNQIRNTPRVYTPEDKTVQAPNSDTPYSHAGLDLRAEPVVLTVPVIDRHRYFSVQLIDAYTHNFAYIGTRATGNDGGDFLIAGPGWEGVTPDGIKAVIKSETDFVLAWYRTQLINADDLENVMAVQSGYEVRPLSQFLGAEAPTQAPEIDWRVPLSREEQRTSPEFFDVLNFALQFGPTHASEEELMERFAKLNIGGGLDFDFASLSPELQEAVEAGISDAWESLAELMIRVNAGEVTSGDAFGTREHLANDYLVRMAGAAIGIYANSVEEAMYPVYFVDRDGQELDASMHRYTLRFASGEYPPVDAFWSLTMYELPSGLLVANPLDRYLLNSPMLQQFELDADGGLTLYLQRDSPGEGRGSNWLPAPNGPFQLVLRLYLPKPEALGGTWTAPQLIRRSDDQASR